MENLTAVPLEAMDTIKSIHWSNEREKAALHSAAQEESNRLLLFRKEVSDSLEESLSSLEQAVLDQETAMERTIKELAYYKALALHLDNKYQALCDRLGHNPRLDDYPICQQKP